MSTAITSPERLIIRASAGTGKTFQLTNRYLRQLHSGARCDEILASTFTRKAAGEILERVLQRLAVAALSDAAAADLAEHLDASDFDRSRALELLAGFTQSLHRVQICTLDALFLRVASSMSLELGLMPGWSIIEETDDSGLRDHAIDSMIQSGGSADIINLTRLLSKGEYRQKVAEMIRAAVTDVHDLAQETSPAAWDWFPPIERMSDAEFESLLTVFPDVPVGSRGDRAHTAATEDARNEDWDAFFARGLAPKIVFEDAVFYGKRLPEEGIDAYRRMFVRAAVHYYERVTTQTRATRKLAEKFEQHYEQVKREARGMLFNDVPRRLVRSLDRSDTARVAWRMNSDIRHVLLDEFQDTSLMQWHAVRSLLLGPGGARLSSFFCVGDTKQAIYGWRGGVAEIFDAVPEEIPDISEAPLNQSRRSFPAIIDTVNNVFSTLPTLNDLEDYEEPVRLWSQRFQEHETALGEEPEAADRSHARLLVAPTKCEGDDQPEYFAFVAAEAARLCQQSPGCTVGVLTRTNRFASRIAFHLRRLGVPASEEGGSAIADSAAVLAVLSVLQLADNPGDTAARFHVANSPLGPVVKLTDAESETQAVRCGAQVRRSLAEKGYGQTLYDLTEAVLESCSMRDVVRLRQVIEAGWKFDSSPTPRTRDFIEIVESRRVEAPTEDRIRVMTIHKSKGLEFDIVVLPELNYISTYKRVSWAAEDRTESPDRVCTHIKRVAQEILPPEFGEVYRQTRNREVIESLCLLYVGMTRAAHALHMIIEPDGELKKKRRFNQKWYARYSGLVRAALCLSTDATAESVMYERGNPDWFEVEKKYRDVPVDGGDDIRIRPANGLNLKPMDGGRRRGLQRSAPSVHRTKATTVDRLMTAEHTEARLRGSVIHKWFEQILWLDDALPANDALLNALDDPACGSLDLDAMLADFHAVLESRAVQKALSRSAYQSSGLLDDAIRNRLASGELTLDVTNERPFAVRSGPELIAGTIDRLVLIRSPKRVEAADIIDFKTDQVRNQKQLKSLRDVYAEQLEVYRHAVMAMFDLPQSAVTTRLLMTQAGVVIEV